MAKQKFNFDPNVELSQHAEAPITHDDLIANRQEQQEYEEEED